MKASVTFSESGGKAPTQEKVPTQGREDTSIQQPPAIPRDGEVSTQEREGTAVQQPPTAPRTGGLDPLNLIGLLVVMAALGILGWVIRRRSS